VPGCEVLECEVLECDDADPALELCPAELRDADPVLCEIDPPELWLPPEEADPPPPPDEPP
jgi:hypothetical protein